MSSIAAAQTADRIDCWIRRHLIQYCYETHATESQSKFNSARDRRVGLLAIGQCLKHQYDALATTMPRHLAALVKQLERRWNLECFHLARSPVHSNSERC